MRCAERRTWGSVVCSIGASLTVTTAQAEDAATTAIWYRSQEGCPNAAAFLARVEARGIRARIAQVGDSIDFVVTVSGSSAEGRGLLERQTKNGTVAVRLLEGGSCDEIVDGMALSLALANSPESRDTAAEKAPSPESPAPVMTTKTPKDSAPAARDERAGPPPLRRPWALGAHATSLLGTGPNPLFGGTVFVGFTPGEARPAPSFRLAAFGDFGGATTDAHEYRLALFGVRMEGAIRLGWPNVNVNPLVAIDLGALDADGAGTDGRSDTAFWAALRPGLRLSVPLSDIGTVEAQVEGVVPFVRYHVRSAGPPQATLYDAAPIGLAAAVGAGFFLP